jgi:hypothetical protein
MKYPLDECRTEHGGGSACLFRLVKCHSRRMIVDDDIERSDFKVFVEIGDAEVLLDYFLIKYFDKTLVYNTRQLEDGTFPWQERCRPAEFEWCLEHNFYTKAAARKMLDEISEVADALEASDLTRIPDGIMKHSPDSFTDPENMKRIVAFYRQFVERMTDMLNENPEWPLLSVMGP